MASRACREKDSLVSGSSAGRDGRGTPCRPPPRARAWGGRGRRARFGPGLQRVVLAAAPPAPALVGVRVGLRRRGLSRGLAPALVGVGGRVRGPRGGRQWPVGVNVRPVFFVGDRAVVLVVRRPRVVVEVGLVPAQPGPLDPARYPAASAAPGVLVRVPVRAGLLPWTAEVSGGRALFGAEVIRRGRRGCAPARSRLRPTETRFRLTVIIAARLGVAPWGCATARPGPGPAGGFLGAVTARAEHLGAGLRGQRAGRRGVVPVVVSGFASVASPERGVGVVESALGAPAALPSSCPAGDQTTSVLARARTAGVTPRRAEVVVETIMAAASDPATWVFVVLASAGHRPGPVGQRRRPLRPAPASALTVADGTGGGCTVPVPPRPQAEEQGRENRDDYHDPEDHEQSHFTTQQTMATWAALARHTRPLTRTCPRCR